MTDYRSLYDVLPAEVWKEFSFSDYWKSEQNILKPALEVCGYSNIRFLMGERDSFGPLSRIVIATINGKDEYFFYG